MIGPTRRRFNVTDGMVLVGVAAAGLATGRFMFMESGAALVFGRFADVEHAFSIFVLMLTVALLGLRLRSPRPARHELFRQPGFSACAAGCATFACQLAQEAGDGICYWDPNAFGFPGVTDVVLDTIARQSGYIGAPIGLSVLSVWVVTSLAGCREPEPSWIDRAGRAVGLYWIGSGWVCKVIEWGLFLRTHGSPWW